MNTRMARLTLAVLTAALAVILTASGIDGPGGAWVECASAATPGPTVPPPTIPATPPPARGGLGLPTVDLSVQTMTVVRSATMGGVCVTARFRTQTSGPLAVRTQWSVESSAGSPGGYQSLRRAACNGTCVWDTSGLCVAGPAGERVTITVRIDPPPGTVHETNETNNVCINTLAADAARATFTCW